MLDRIKKHLADFSAGKWDDYKAGLANDAVYEEVGGARAEGADKYMEAVQRWKRAFPDTTANVVNVVGSGDNWACEIEWEGTHRGAFEGPFGTIPATNKKGRIRSVLLYTLKGDKIASARHYVDVISLLRQLGIAPGLGAQPGAMPEAATQPRH